MKNRLSPTPYCKSFKIFLFLLTICHLPYAILGCGYTTRSMIASKYRTIYVVPFVNKIEITKETDVGSRYKIYRPMLESDITKKVVNKFLFDGNLKPSREESADLILRGEVIDFRKDPLRYDENDEVAEYRINLVVNISLWDRKDNTLVWQEDGFTGDTSYFTSYATGSGVEIKTEAQAMESALNELARRILERTVEQW